MDRVEVKISLLPHGQDLGLPLYASLSAAGLDLMAAIEAEIEIEPFARALVPAGFAMALPPGYEGQIRPRSGLAYRQGLSVLNAPGTIDSDYRGEVKILLVNFGDQPIKIKRGDRIAQLIVAPVSRVSWVEEGALDQTARGDGGLGSTGLGSNGIAASSIGTRSAAR